jgi:hypothetical protein
MDAPDQSTYSCLDTLNGLNLVEYAYLLLMLFFRKLCVL